MANVNVDNSANDANDANSANDANDANNTNDANGANVDTKDEFIIKIEGNTSPIYEKDTCINKVQELFNKYNDNQYITQKLKCHIMSHLPLMLESANNTHIKRTERKQQLTTDQTEFTSTFLNKNHYYYIQNTELFINYDKTSMHYKIYREDDILHEILSKITHDKCLIPWKYKIKLNVIKLIKERNIFDCIPDTETIQNVIRLLYPTIFNDKHSAKYFLTILGDIILRKNDTLLYLTNSGARNFIKFLSMQCYNFFGNVNIINNFKYKYHEQYVYKNIRLLNFSSPNNIDTELSKNILDLFCVAVHYSNRHISADEYLTSINDNNLISHAFYLKDKTQETLVDNFTVKSLNKCNNTNISFKNILYLWKLSLDEQNLPNAIYANTLKKLLKERVDYDENSDSFLNISSTSLPFVSKFLSFWDETITEDSEEQCLEIDEIIVLFKIWYKLPIVIKDTYILNLIKHYYSDIIIENDKYILNIKCNLWDKKEDLRKSLTELKIISQKKQEKYSLAIDYAYEFYCKNGKKNIMIVGKKYFEEYVSEYLSDYLDEDKLIMPYWWQNE